MKLVVRVCAFRYSRSGKTKDDKNQKGGRSERYIFFLDLKMSFFQTLLVLLIFTHSMLDYQVEGEAFRNNISLSQPLKGFEGPTKNHQHKHSEWHNQQHLKNNKPEEISVKETPYVLKIVCRIRKINPANCTCDKAIAYNFTGFCEKVTPISTPCRKTQIELVKHIFISIISFLGIIGNILVLVVRVRNWKNSLHYQLISGLAITDLLFCFVFISITFPSIWLCKWYLGAALCTLLKTLLTFTSNVDLGFILIIAIERYVGIVHPFSGGASARKIYLMILINIVVGTMSVSHFFFIFKVDQHGECVDDWSRFTDQSQFIYNWISNIFLFTIPIIITAVLYYRGLRTLNSTLFRPEMMQTLDNVSRKRMISENRRILKIASTILLAFFLLVGPIHLSWFLHDNFPDLDSGKYHMFAISSITYSLHASINPIIYSIIDPKFRKNVFSLLRKGRRRNSFTTLVTAENPPQIYQLSTIDVSNSEHIENPHVEL